MPIFRRRSSRAAEQAAAAAAAARDKPPSLPELKPDLTASILSPRSAADLRQRFMQQAEQSAPLVVAPSTTQPVDVQAQVAPAGPISQPLRRSPSGRPIPPEGTYSSSARRVPIVVTAAVPTSDLAVAAAAAGSPPASAASSGSATFPRAYHRPWTREGISPATFGGGQPSGATSASPGSTSTAFSTQQANFPPHTTTTSQQPSSTQSPSRSRPPPSSYRPIPTSASWSSSTTDPNLLPSPSTDFRVSPFSMPAPSPNARKQAHEAARKMSLRRAKAPQSLNLVVMGARGAGKTSWIRTLISTLDLSHVTSQEAKRAIALFGLAPSVTHPTRRTNPPTPLATKAYTTLPTMEIPIGGLSAALGESSSAGGAGGRPGSTYSTTSSFMDRSDSTRTIGGGGGPNRILLSITDTDGFDWVLDDEFDTERRVLRAIRFVEDRLTRTLNEESKVKRRPQFDSHIDAILYFIDPLHLIERTLIRRSDREKLKARRVRESMSRRRAEEQKDSATTATAAPSSSVAMDPRKRSASNPQAAAAGLARSRSESSALHKSSHTRKRSISQGRVSGIKVNGTPSSRPPPPPTPATATTADGSTTGTSSVLSTSSSGGRTPVQRKEVGQAALELAREMEAAGAVSSIDIGDGNADEGMDHQEEVLNENDEEEEEDEECTTSLSLAPCELKIIYRLSQRATVIPIIAKSDLLTAERLQEVREAVKKGWKEAGIGWGPFEPSRNENEDEMPTRQRRGPWRGTHVASEDASARTAQGEDLPTEPGVKLIRIRSRRSFSSKRSPSIGHGDGYGSEDGSTALHDTRQPLDAKEEAEDLFRSMPLAVFAPEPVRVEMPVFAKSATTAMAGSNLNQNASTTTAPAAHHRSASSSSAKSVARKLSNVLAHQQQQQQQGSALVDPPTPNGAIASNALVALGGTPDLAAITSAAADLDSTPGVPPPLLGGTTQIQNDVPPVPKIPREIAKSLGTTANTSSSSSTATATATATAAAAAAATTGTESPNAGTTNGGLDSASHRGATEDGSGESIVVAQENPQSSTSPSSGAVGGAFQPFPTPTMHRPPTSPSLSSLRPLTSSETSRLLRLKRLEEEESYLLSLPPRFERAYRWGTSSVLDGGHCDFLRLRWIILGGGTEGLKEETRRVYEVFRERKLEERRGTAIMSDAEHGRLLKRLEAL